MELIAQETDSVVISDDRHFLALLKTQGAEFLTPSDTLVVMARRGTLTGDGAMAALERLRPAIRRAASWEARQDSELGGKSHEEE